MQQSLRGCYLILTAYTGSLIARTAIRAWSGSSTSFVDDRDTSTTHRRHVRPSGDLRFGAMIVSQDCGGSAPKWRPRVTACIIVALSTGRSVPGKGSVGLASASPMHRPVSGLQWVPLKVLQHEADHASAVTSADTYLHVFAQIAHPAVAETAALLLHAKIRMSVAGSSQA
jgi:hypothetical protein